MNNPLMEEHELPKFGLMEPAHIEPAIDELIARNRKEIDELLQSNQEYTWRNTLLPVEQLNDRLNKAWSPVSHLHGVVDNEALRGEYNKCVPKLSQYATEMGQHKALYQAYKAVAGSKEYSELGDAERKVIDNALRDFRLSGIDLPADKQQEFKQIKQELSELQTKYEENLLDATHAWTKLVTDEKLLSGLPESARSLARQHAQQKGKEGYLFTLDFPSYIPVMTYADDGALRREMYTAYVTRASGQGPTPGEWDNSEIMVRILKLRQRQAKLLGFNNYAECSLATKMADDPDKVLSFLYGLARRSRDVAVGEFQELRNFAHERFGLELEAWDVAYVSEHLRLQKYNLSQEELRPYFPVPKVLHGMFEVVGRLYGLRLEQRADVDVWHDDVGFYQIFDAAGILRGQFYLDLYAREHKRGGAWMDECRVRKESDGRLQLPVAYLTTNFTPPLGDEPSLLTHSEVMTLFHEFGHGLHHMLTRVAVPSVSGIHGVAWDAVELPSQFMENWCWEKEALALISGHYQTGEPLPDSLYQRMLAARNFQAGMQLARQLEFALFDFKLHMATAEPGAEQIQALLDQVRAEVAVVIPPHFNRFQNGFSHIFAGGYAAGYYSYKWAEVLSADAFSKFEERGIFDRRTGSEFLECILEKGGSRDAMELFTAFRGRLPNIEALLRHSGIAA